MMRQYELVERVTRYNPNADENLLNKAYVYAMQKHGSQQRANGDLYFSHPLEVAGHPDRPQARRRHHRGGAPPRHHRGHRRHPRRDRPDVRRGHRPPGRGPHQDQEARPGVEEGGAGREPSQAAARYLVRHPRAAGEARRPAAQHAHARVHAGGGAAAASPRRRWRSTRRSPAAWACTTCARSSRSSPSAPSIRKPTPRSRSAWRDCAPATARLIERDRARADRAASIAPASRPRSRGARSGPTRSSARWSARPSASSSSPTSSASASSSAALAECYAAIGVVHTHLAGGARPLQGLHLDAEAERLPVDPHHRHRPRQRSASSCRSAPPRCTASPSTASPRTRSTRTAWCPRRGKPTAPQMAMATPPTARRRRRLRR